MQFELTGPYTASRTDSTAPCTLFDDVVGQTLPAGNYELIVRAIPAAGIGRDDLIKTIDADQGRPGSHAGERKGFAGLVDEVAHGRAGAVFRTGGQSFRQRVHSILRNPAMGGAYAYGRQRTERILDEGDQVRRIIRRISRADWQVLITDSTACAQIRVFAENNDLPVGCSFRCRDYFDNRHPNYVGHVGIGRSQALRRRVIESDLLIVVGARLGEITTDGYTLLDVPRPKQSIAHLHPGAEELGRVYQADLPINASPRAFAAALAELEPLRGTVWVAGTAAGHRVYLATLEPQSNPGAVQMGRIARWLNDTLPDDVLICNGAGNYATWMHRFFQYRQYRNQLAPTSGSMGYGLPAAVAAKLVHPDRIVVSMNGDGCFMMHGQELATAMQYGVNIIVIVVNNGMCGTIRMHQEEGAATVSARELCPAVRDAGTSRAAGDLCTPLQTQTVSKRAESRHYTRRGVPCPG